MNIGEVLIGGAALGGAGIVAVTIDVVFIIVSFVMDTGITDPKVQMYGPVVSTVPGSIVVWDVQIVG